MTQVLSSEQEAALLTSITSYSHTYYPLSPPPLPPPISSWYRCLPRNKRLRKLLRLLWATNSPATTPTVTLRSMSQRRSNGMWDALRTSLTVPFYQSTRYDQHTLPLHTFSPSVPYSHTYLSILTPSSRYRPLITSHFRTLFRHLITPLSHIYNHYLSFPITVDVSEFDWTRSHR